MSVWAQGTEVSFPTLLENFSALVIGSHWRLWLPSYSSGFYEVNGQEKYLFEHALKVN